MPSFADRGVTNFFSNINDISDAAMNPISYLDSGVISSGLFAVNASDLRADHLSEEKI
jgi:ABC-type transporter lipoprotein component MlaA